MTDMAAGNGGGEGREATCPMCGAKDKWTATPAPVHLPQADTPLDSGFGLDVQPMVCGCGAVTLMMAQ